MTAQDWIEAHLDVHIITNKVERTMSIIRGNVAIKEYCQFPVTTMFSSAMARLGAKSLAFLFGFPLHMINSLTEEELLERASEFSATVETELNKTHELPGSFHFGYWEATGDFTLLYKEEKENGTNKSNSQTEKLYQNISEAMRLSNSGRS